MIELVSTSILDAKNTGTCWHLVEEECCGMPLVNNGKFKWCQNPRCIRNEISMGEWWNVTEEKVKDKMRLQAELYSGGHHLAGLRYMNTYEFYVEMQEKFGDED